MRTLHRFALLVATFALVPTATAGATTFCVPAFSAACPDNGTNVAQPNLETAMQANAADGVADRIVIAAGTLTDPDTWEDGGTDALEVVGAGPAATVLTSSDNGNQYVMNLAAGGRAITVRDLTIRVPASFPDGLGGALQAQGAVLENVDVESRNPGSDGPAFVGGGVFRDGAIRGAQGGSIDDGISTNGADSGPLTIERSTIDDASWGILVDTPNVPVTIDRVRISDPLAYGVRMSGSGTATVTNTVITADTAEPFSISSAAPAGITLTARHVTLIALPGIDEPAITIVAGGGLLDGPATATLSDAIIRGFPDTYDRSAAVNIFSPNANLTIQHSNFVPTGLSSGDGTLSIATGNLNADPVFAAPGAGDYRLLPGSPSIDAGDPAAGGPATDGDGLARAVDGNADGVARRDQGAFEYQPPAPPAGPGADPPTTTSPPLGPGPGPAAPGAGPGATDRTRPVLSALKVLAPISALRGGRLQVSCSERARIVLTFTRVARRAKPRRVRVTFTARKGRNVLRIKRRALKAARFRLSAVATDAAGNRSTALRRTVTVRAR